MGGIAKIDAIIREKGYDSFKWISGDEIVVSQWVRFKCLYTCWGYNTSGTCPPNAPPVNECREFFRDYDRIVVLHFSVKLDDPEDRHDWANEVNRKLLELERLVFLEGYYKAFLLFMAPCRFCKDCSLNMENCKIKKDSRPCPEGLAMDVFATVRKCDLPIDVLTDYTDEMNRYAFLLVE